MDRIQNGAYAIESVTDETLKKQISDYENYYNKRSKCDEDLIALEEKKEQAQKSYADKTISYHEKEISRMERSISAREAFVKLSEAFGGHAGKKSLKKQQNLSAKALATLRKQNKELVNLQKTVDKGTQAWDAYQEQIKKNNDSSKRSEEHTSELQSH